MEEVVLAGVRGYFNERPFIEKPDAPGAETNISTFN